MLQWLVGDDAVHCARLRWHSSGWKELCTPEHQTDPRLFRYLPLMSDLRDTGAKEETCQKYIVIYAVEAFVVSA